MFGLEIAHSVKLVPLSQVDVAQRRNLGFSRISNNSERWDLPNVQFRPLPQDDPRVHGFLSQTMKSSLRVFDVDAPQHHNMASLAGFPTPATTEALTGSELGVNIAFTANLTQAQADGFARRYFTFSGHRKLYLLDSLGVVAGSRSGRMTFLPNCQAEVESGETINFVNPKIRVAFAEGLPPDIQTTDRGFWRIAVDLEESW